MELGATTWTDVDRPVVLVPVGSCEQHGPHLPLHTDTVIATALANEVAERRSDCTVAPAVTVSASGEHAGFPGTLSIGTAAMTDVVIELARSADWARGVVFVNGHGGNAEAMERAGATFDRERRSVLIWWPRVPDGDPHAGHTETSVMLAIAPEQVRLEQRVAGPVPSMDELVAHGVRAVSESGVLGDPTTATADQGAAIFASLAEQLTSAVADWLA